MVHSVAPFLDDCCVIPHWLVGVNKSKGVPEVRVDPFNSDFNQVPVPVTVFSLSLFTAHAISTDYYEDRLSSLPFGFVKPGMQLTLVLLDNL